MALYFSALAFAVTLVFLMVIPSYGMYTMVLTGTLMMSSNLVYYLMFPSHVQTVVVEGAPLRFNMHCKVAGEQQQALIHQLLQLFAQFHT